MGAILVAKPARLLGKVVRHPERAALRLVLQWRISREGQENRRARLLTFLSERYGVDAWALDGEYVHSDYARWHQERVDALREFPGPYRVGTTDELDCRYLYVLVRAARPRTVIETGVLYGASSGHILAALEANEQGTLHSIELGRETRAPPHDFLYPRTCSIAGISSWETAGVSFPGWWTSFPRSTSSTTTVCIRSIT